MQIEYWKCNDWETERERESYRWNKIDRQQIMKRTDWKRGWYIATKIRGETERKNGENIKNNGTWGKIKKKNREGHKKEGWRMRNRKIKETKMRETKVCEKEK